MPTIHRAAAITLTALLAAIAAPAQAETHDEANADTGPSYDWIGAGYFWQNSDDPDVSDPQGFAIAGSIEPVDRLVVTLAVERGVAKLDPAIGDASLAGRALVGSVGSYVPLTDAIHLQFSAGLDFEHFRLEYEGESDSVDQYFASFQAGIAARPIDQLELGLSMQRLEPLNDAAEGEGRWVARADAAWNLGGNWDAVTSIAYENDQPAVIAGVRLRF